MIKSGCQDVGCKAACRCIATMGSSKETLTWDFQVRSISSTNTIFDLSEGKNSLLHLLYATCSCDWCFKLEQKPTRGWGFIIFIGRGGPVHPRINKWREGGLGASAASHAKLQATETQTLQSNTCLSNIYHEQQKICIKKLGSKYRKHEDFSMKCHKI